MPKPPLLGKRFGKLLVIKELSKRNHRGEVVWVTKCDCGNKRKVVTEWLLSGNTKTCGCSHFRKGKVNPKYKGYKDVPIYYFKKLNRHKRKFTITIKYVANLLEKQNYKCALSGLPITLCSRDNTASLDRINNKKGYIKRNVQWVHKDVNRMKSDFTQNNFIILCKNIAKYNK